ncbi:Concanavalin A-like lectin/glucanase, subgroup [Cynara cardunculus var. scolymus]|uniref:non-specific serine/threonine protein kinase n=1 Tax=Cynara cardunculus var. scolymus TaxID=59895 RepID=A0A103Y3V3_CYNCS|nr:Concanavalin A-like lectin/glucanase, subgroup [Cynara cardunculus var. scolymus]
MLELNLGFRLVIFVFLSSIGFCSLVQSRCNTGCDLALGSYYVESGNDLTSIAQYTIKDIATIVRYNRDTIRSQDSLPSFIRINIPFSCDCINGEFLGHVFNYDVRSQDTYAVIAEQRYANLTTADWIGRFNNYDPNRIPDTGSINVTVNCSCGDDSVSSDYGLFVTYPLRQGETLNSVSSAANLSSDLIRRYNPDANFSAGRGLVYIPGRGLSGGAIGGIAVGVVAGVLLVAGCLYCGFYRKKHSEKSLSLLKNAQVQLMQSAQTPNGTSVGGSDSRGLPAGASPGLTGITVDKSVEFSYEELAKATDDFSLANKIGQGGFGAVFYAELRGEKAAIKKMDMQASREFLAELKVLTHVHHLNLVRLIGYCVEGSLFLVYEYIENGNLSQHLHGSGRDPLPWSTRVQIALDSARGLEYIHEHTVPVYIHRDIKSANILIDKNFHGKVADFGLTKLTEVGSTSLPTRLVGTFGYMPPEYAQYGDVSPKVDVYAFGVVLYELISAKEAIVKANGDVAESKGLVALMAQLAKACTHENPQLRPSMRSIVVALMTLSSTTEDWDVGSFYENQTLVNLINPNHLLRNLSHNLSTLVNPRKPSSQLPSKQTKIKERSQIVDYFKRARTYEEMIKAFESMDASFDHHELDLASCKSDSNSMKKVQESVPYLEDATERLKENFGSKHFGVGYVQVMLELNLGFRFSAFLLLLTSIDFCSLVQSRCNRGCDLALGSYYVESGNNLSSVSQYTINDIDTIARYNRDIIHIRDSLPSFNRLNIPFSCDCIAGEFLGHVFNYEIQSGDTYDVIAELRYANLTTADWIGRFNTYDPNVIPVNAPLNVTVNCSCGDDSVSREYGLFVTYPLRQGETLNSVSSAANLSSDLVRRYNPDVNFGAGRGLVYIPGPDANGNYPPLRTRWSHRWNNCSSSSWDAVTCRMLILWIIKESTDSTYAGCSKFVSFYNLFPNGSSVGGSDSRGLPAGVSPLFTGVTVDKSMEFSYEELSKATNDFSLANKIGQGGFGAVFYAELRGEKAAIKKMDMQASREFLAEMKVLTHVHHLNLVRLIGYCVEGSLFLVYGYIENGNLSQHLHGSGMDPLPWSARLQIALDSARGLEYIHEHTVPVYIHRDIKSANILIDENFRGKVADFGLTKLIELGSSSLRTRLVGTFGYMPPEYARNGTVSPKVDVYAFGVVLYELISAKEAVIRANGSDAEAKGLVALPDPEADMVKLIDPRLGDSYPLDSVRKMAQLAKACTRDNPRLRPSMRSIVVALMTLSSTTENWDAGSFSGNQTLLNLGFRFAALVLLLSSIGFGALVQSKCHRGCDLALGSYNVEEGNDLISISTYINNDVNSIIKYNPTTIPESDNHEIQSPVRINVPFSCGCINGEFLGHVFNYEVQSQDIYEVIAEQKYANLTTAAWIQMFNSYDPNRIPDTARINVTINCSCGDSSVSREYGLFVTYPLQEGETLDSVSSSANLSSDLIRRYNPDVNFSAGSGLVYIPARGLSGGTIGGITVAVVAGVLLLAGCLCYGIYRKKDSENSSVLLKNAQVQLMQAAQNGGSDSRGLPAGASPGVTGVAVDKSVEFSYEELSKATDDFSLANKIGQGGFGVVFYAELRGEKAAIKKMDMQASREFLAELKVLTHVHHLNLVRLIGYCVEDSLFLVYEYIENGNLSQRLHGSGMDPLPWSARLQIALDSARGLEYIHEHTVPVYIHRDIKSANILIDKNFHGKIADFGLAKLTEVGGASLPTRLVGTFGYMPAEYARYGTVSPKVDVYAFGVVLYELISAKEAIVKANDSVTEPIGLIALMAELAKACTHENPQLRPNMRSIVVALMTLSSTTEDWDIGSFYENQTLEREKFITFLLHNFQKDPNSSTLPILDTHFSATSSRNRKDTDDLKPKEIRILVQN